MEEVLDVLKEQLQCSYQTAYNDLIRKDEGAVALRLRKEMADAIDGILSIKKRFMDV